MRKTAIVPFEGPVSYRTSGLRGFLGEGADGFDARLLGRIHYSYNLSEGGFFVRAQGELEVRIFGGGGGQFAFQPVGGDGHGVVSQAQRAVFLDDDNERREVTPPRPACPG